MQVFSSEIHRNPQIRLPLLSGLDEYTIRRLYSPLVADMVRAHPKLVDLIGAGAITLIESMANKKGSLDEEIETELASLNIEVIKARLNATRAKHDRQRAVKEPDTVEREAFALPQGPLGNIEKRVINVVPSLLTRPLPENVSSAAQLLPYLSLLRLRAMEALCTSSCLECPRRDASIHH